METQISKYVKILSNADGAIVGSIVVDTDGDEHFIPASQEASGYTVVFTGHGLPAYGYEGIKESAEGSATSCFQCHTELVGVYNITTPVSINYQECEICGRREYEDGSVSVGDAAKAAQLLRRKYAPSGGEGA